MMIERAAAHHRAAEAAATDDGRDFLLSAFDDLAERHEALDVDSEDSPDDTGWYDLIAEAADGAADLIYTRRICDVFYAVDGLRWLGEHVDEYGAESIERAWRIGTGQYGPGPDSLAVLAIYTCVEMFLRDCVDL